MAQKKDIQLQLSNANYTTFTRLLEEAASSSDAKVVRMAVDILSQLKKNKPTVKYKTTVRYKCEGTDFPYETFDVITTDHKPTQSDLDRFREMCMKQLRKDHDKMNMEHNWNYPFNPDEHLLDFVTVKC